MKKQILILTFFVAAILAGTSSAFAQTNNHYDASGDYLQVLDGVPGCITAQPLTGCTSTDALQPVQGVEYTYTVASTTGNETVRWFVINNADLKDATIGGAVDSIINSNNDIIAVTNNTYIDAIDGTGAYDNSSTSYILSLGANNSYNDPASTNHSIDISWKYFDGFLPNEVLLVAYVEDEVACTNNIGVFRIIPQPSFSLDVAVLSQSGDSVAAPGTATYGECVSPIEFATYTAADNTTPNGTLTVDYGENWAYFIVNAANYIDSWRPSFQITYNGGVGYNALEASWAYAGDAASTTGWNDIVNIDGSAFEDIPVIAGGSEASPGAIGDGVVPAAGGECIVVRVRMDWGTLYEHDDAVRTLSFAVNGIYYDGVGSDISDLYDDEDVFGDLHTTTCDQDGFTNDAVDYNITPRPEVEPGTPNQETKTGDEG